MRVRQFFMENFAGDLEYSPRRGGIYLVLSACALFYWAVSPHQSKLDTIPLVLALGSPTLLLKGIFLFRKSSEGFGLTQPELFAHSNPSDHRAPASIVHLAAQAVQDFSIGPILLSPILSLGKTIDRPWNSQPETRALIGGVVLFCLGRLIRRLTPVQLSH